MSESEKKPVVALFPVEDLLKLTATMRDCLAEFHDSCKRRSKEVFGAEDGTPVVRIEECESLEQDFGSGEEIAAEIDRLVRKLGKTRIELLKVFWNEERGRAHNEQPDKAANRFKQSMHKAKRGTLGPVGERELTDFLCFLRRLPPPGGGANAEEKG